MHKIKIFLVLPFVVLLAACSSPKTQTESLSKWFPNRAFYQSLETDQLRLEAARGSQEARVRLAIRLMNGDRIERDIKQGADIFLELAADGDARAQYFLGVAHVQGAGVEKDDSKAVSWFRKSANQGYDMGQYWHGFMLSRGRGTAGKDWRTALKWFRKAASQGHGDAQFSLGEAYESCRGGLKRDYETAAKWYRRADGTQDHMPARFNLRRLIDLGLIEWQECDGGLPPTEPIPLQPEYIRACTP